jgi:hypothetical protein
MDNPVDAKSKNPFIQFKCWFFDIYDKRRNALLIINPELASEEFTKPLCLVMDLGAPKGTITLFAFSNGSSGKLSCGKRGQLRECANLKANHYTAQAVQSLVSYLPKMSLSQQQPRPETGCVQFQILTNNGIYSASAEWGALLNGYSIYQPLYKVGWDLLKRVENETNWVGFLS